MKKVVVVLLALAMMGTLVACGSKAEKNEIIKLFDEGYTCVMSSACETEWRGMFMKDGSYDAVYKIIAPMTTEQYERFSAIAYDDEKAEEKQRVILRELADIDCSDIANMVPTQEELDSFAGMTIGDMEDMGFENSGWIGEPGEGYSFYYDGPVFYCTVTPVEGTVIEDMDDYSANDIRALEIGSVEFMGLSSQLLDQ